MSALMTDPNHPETKNGEQRWQGFAEIDQAIHENRLTEYRLRKSWADPLGRKLTIVVTLVIVLGFSFLIGATYGLW